MFVLLLPIHEINAKNGINDLMDLVAVDPVSGDMITFPSEERAVEFRDENTISCRVIELFII